ncbi:hypothetical protein ABIE44_002958 [Marmoricola sp. OAE513]|uniref:hypothetical protein n=1 Tax=Marmoricola sp. OAE513 TaxID=2817894 RepID=UPI001D23C951
MFVADLVGPMVPMHGFGGAKDLPVPAPLAIAGGTAALIVSFCVLILAWRKPRYDDSGSGRGAAGRPLPGKLAAVLDSPAYVGLLKVLGLAFTAFMVWALVAGPDLTLNPVFGVFYVLLWVGLVPASLLFGRFYRAINPIRTVFGALSWALRVNPSKGVFTYPEKLGYWPAAVGLFAFVWQELVNPRGNWISHSGLHPGVEAWLAVYAMVMLLGAAVFGDTWISRADPFEVYSDLLAKLSPWGRNTDGVLVWRSPLANLATLVPRPGTVAVVAVLFGSTAFDSYKDTIRWVKVLSKVDSNVELVNTAALLVMCLVIGGAFAIATMSTGIDTEAPDAVPRSRLPRLFAHSVIPIIVGYMTAHYLSYFVEQGQTTLIQLSDPMADGSNLFGTADYSVNYWLSTHPTFLASTKVVAVVLGHIVGVVAAHDRALTLLPKKHQVTGQIGLLVVMVFFTASGLYLLFGA